MPGADPSLQRVQVLAGRTRDLSPQVSVRRLLPAVERRLVGPFAFFDHFGPLTFQAGHGMDVRPHPHINLATVTYLFEGEMVHRDSLGTEQVIRPGDVNWMHAGRGIAHSERSSADRRKSGGRMHGLQLWVGLRQEHEDSAPTFEHVAADRLPLVERPGARVRLIAGAAYGAQSPVRVLSTLFYADAQIDAGAELTLPDGHADRALYVLDGTVVCDGQSYTPGHMLLFPEGNGAGVVAAGAAHVMLLGGVPLDGERHIWWNFLSSSPARIEQAKQDWRDRKFARIPGDDQDFIPLPA